MKKSMVLLFLVVLCIPALAWSKIGGGDIVFRPSGAGNVVYSHDDHVAKHGLKCRECHYQVFHTVESHQPKTMTDMQNGQSCGTCHNGKRAFDVKTNCTRCHQ